MPKVARELAQLSSRVDAMRAAEVREDLLGVVADPVALEVAVLLATCLPATLAPLRARPNDAVSITREGWRAARGRAALVADARAAVLDAGEGFRGVLRRWSGRERLRIALREILPRSLGGADVDATARELSHLADATIEVALEEAVTWAVRRFGLPTRSDGAPSTFVVIGMGKLGGEELNAGSDVDLIYFYDSDDGAVHASDGAAEPTSLHELWLRVARRLTENLEELTEDGAVWRVDLRLRPEGASGPLVNSVAAAERYYESFGRLWERAALLRARPVAGDLALGERILRSLDPFVWRRRIDPSIAVEMVALVHRSRAELSEGGARDLKLGPGGIREAEFFVQTLQLVWGGREPSLRDRPTLAALSRLEAKGLCTVREASDIADAYLALRRAEHVTQCASGVQTHLLPRGRDLTRLARTLGFPSEDAFLADLARHRRRVEQRFLSLLPADVEPASASKWAPILGPLERGDEAALRAAVAPLALGWGRTDEEDILAFTNHLLELGRHPDAVLGVRTQETYPGLADTLLDALTDAADPLQAARYLRFFFSRVRQPAVYVRLAFTDPLALRRLVGTLGASAFIGDALCNNPELGDVILFSRGSAAAERIADEVTAAAAAHGGPDEDPDEAFVGALRLAKTRLTLETALADLAGALPSRAQGAGSLAEARRAAIRDVNHALTALADASLEAAIRRASGSEPGERVRGLAIIAMGKLGGREISYGSDLDVLFVYDPDRGPPGAEAGAHFARVARKVIRYISTFHGAGPGYDLDTRLRPSGNQGLLVTTVEAFARYHGVPSGEEPQSSAPRAAVWERMALTRARFAAGDEDLGARFVAVARSAAFDRTPDAEQTRELRRIRARVEREASGERAGVHDLKLGRGALLDVEFVVQYLSLRHAAALADSERVADTLSTLDALRRIGALAEEDAAALHEAYTFLRALELRVRIVRADGAHLLEERPGFLGPLARRMNMRDHPARTAAESLMAAYRDHTGRVRAVFEDVFGALPTSGGVEIGG